MIEVKSLCPRITGERIDRANAKYTKEYAYLFRMIMPTYYNPIGWFAVPF
jgi:hypothetical protein